MGVTCGAALRVVREEGALATKYTLAKLPLCWKTTQTRTQLWDGDETTVS